MHRLSPVQLLSIWTDLESAYYCQNGFGTDTAEIYMFRLMPCCPMAAAKGKYDAEMVRDSSHTLLAVLWYYAEQRDARIWINGIALESLDKPETYEHRVEVRVSPLRPCDIVSNIAKRLERHIADLPPDARCELKAELFGGYCRECCGADPRCPCSNDE